MHVQFQTGMKWLDKWKILDGMVKLVEEVSFFKNKYWSLHERL